MGKKDFWHEIISLYKSKGSIHERIESALNLVNQVIPCQSCSIFFFDEYAGSLQLEAGTNVKEGLSIPNFRSDSPLWRMFESDEPSRVSDKQLKGEYPTTDVFFENVSTVKSIAFSPISDEKNNKIGLIRLLNRTTEENEVRNFYENDLINLSFFANAFGVLLTISTLRNKYEAFLDSVTHELLAPVSGIKNAGILVRRMAGDPDGEKFKEAKELFNLRINDMIRFSQQAIFLIQGLTMYTKSGRMSRDELDVKPSHLFRDVIEKCRGSVTPLLLSRGFRHNAIRCINRHKWPLLRIDRKIFQQVFNNILSNCIKYALEDRSAFNVLIELEILGNGDAIIVIEDYGIGLEKDEVSKIFDPTFRGRQARAKVTTGTGIGLTTVRNLLLVHECTIEATNPKNPTEFTLTVPKKYIMRRAK